MRRQAGTRRHAATGRGPRGSAALGSAALGAVLLAGCTSLPFVDPPATDDAPAPTAPAAQAPSSRTADDVRADGDPLTAGDVTLTVEAPGPDPQTDTLDDGSVRLTVAVPEGAAAPARVAALAAPVGSTFDVLGDGSVVLRAADGSFAGGLATPATTTSGELLKARLTADGADLLVLDVSRLDGGADLPAGAVTVWFASRMLDRPADWGDREGGRSLAVDPTAWARAGGLAAQEGIWAAVVAQEPEADTNGMRDQMLCHALGAPEKEAWNLEPWRPDVGSFEMLAARCNPT
ncbi:DUF2599 domain-containing protein [Cellulomonas chengniuliangii]|uniref:DUF2599 domain-containing protein n=1 Tax=Cellulomonas chengniuliangii TaxID=2968084 RepID=A0ABY5KYK3_9CELL|nr:DUF2599 domain-containing protein [Cellulomonas chengniuliangii]MCC2307628.1 DUF2599 domain-containing protein [Cellulomonas chengniuliangii]MCC2318736.1 DUF2599 domain-containing protein [Cellulomonas chengniuliangii]UUI75605.1 DUF2599 domain-containing protein [Cellulomonas chengniuliangii]